MGRKEGCLMQPKEPLFFLLTFIVITIFLVSMLNIISLKPYYVESSASIVYYDTMLYEDSAKTKEVTSINWGELTPSENKTFNYYVVNHKKSNAVLFSSTSDWLPVEAQNFLLFEVTPLNSAFGAGELKPLNFTLRVSPDIANITTFSFNIILSMN